MAIPTKRLRVFFLEDNQDDVELELHELRKTGYAVEHEVARTRADFLDRLPRFSPDVVLADYSLPDITGIEAIALCKDANVDAPVILITGEGNEQIAVDSLRLGATDYIIKRNISGLPARVARALAIWSDRKARERAEAEEKRLQHLLFEIQKMEAIGRLTSGIAHDFNNILTGIMGYAELCLKRVPEDQDLADKLRSVIAFSRRGAELIKQLLIFSRKIPLEFEVIDLNAFIRETVQFLKRIIEEAVEIRLDLREGIPKIKCDTRQFTQVLMNLALNARDAMGGRGLLTIRTDTGPLTPEDSGPVPAAGGGGDFVRLIVSDTGTGIDKDDLQRIFDPFFTTKKPGKGTGLGLSIVYAVVNAHGGMIRVSSEKGRGTSFGIFLPPHGERESAKEPSVPLFTDSEKGGGEKRGSETVLVVEDEDLLRELTVSTLTALGYTVLAARDGAEAAELLKTGKQSVNLIISDMIMPNKGGVQLFQEVKAIIPGMKFILVTGYSLTEQNRAVLEQMDAIITKPFTSTDMASVIRDVLDK